ncbi:MAG: hypothetical protein JOZ62_16720 [Acidobacteriaceae bacterium]|nr:hypothetical protein [Acidobacteriaceae bacterium]
MLENIDISVTSKWGFAGAMLAFGPTHSGLSVGNPSVFACSAVTIAICVVLAGRVLLGSIILGLVHCIKPQISVCGVIVFAMWALWKPVFLSLIAPMAAAVASLTRAPSVAQDQHWLATLRGNIELTLAPGGINDPRPTNFFSYHLVNLQALIGIWVRDARVNNIVVFLIAIGMTSLYPVSKYSTAHFRAAGSRLR